jgi:hypothetical protein
MFYVDILESAANNDDVLARAVTETDEAILGLPLPVEIDQAWLAPADTPPLHTLTTEQWAQFTEVTPTAQDLFKAHHYPVMDRELFDILHDGKSAA